MMAAENISASTLMDAFSDNVSKFVVAETSHLYKKPLAGAVFFAASLLLWRLYRFTIAPMLNPNEPKELPYWTPVLGHLFDFFNNADALMTRARNQFGNVREPFALTVLGMKTYVLTKAEDVGEVYRNNDTLSYEEFVQMMMQILGNSKFAVKEMFKPLSKDKRGYPNPKEKPLGILFREMHIHQLFPGENLNFLENRFYNFLSHQLEIAELSKAPYAVQKANTVIVPLVQWCSDYFAQAGQDAYFGPRLADIDPNLTDDFIVFDELSYQVIYQYPYFLAKEMRASRDRILRAFKKYLKIPHEEREGVAWFVNASEDEMSYLNMSDEDKAIAIMTIYWAINTNSRKAAFWLLAYIIQTPSLISIVRKETAPALKADGSIDLEYLHNSVPQLDAMWTEMLRLSAFAASVRYITADTVIGGKTFRRGNRLMIPYRQLHMNEAVFGDDVERFRHERFLEKPKLAQGNNFKPFGGGSTSCPGRHIAKRAVLLFTAIVIQRYDIELADGERMMEADLTKPVPGLMSPKLGEDMLVKLTPRMSEK